MIKNIHHGPAPGLLAGILCWHAAEKLSIAVLTLQQELKARDIPLELNSWHGREGKVEQYVKDILETDDVVERDYTSAEYPGAPVKMAIVYSPDNRRVAHPPEVCYLGAGWEMTSKEMISPEGTPQLVRLIMAYGQNKDVILYCYKSGTEITANYYQQQWNIVCNQLTRKSGASALIRFSSRIIDNEDATQERILAFIRDMMPEIKTKLND